MTKITLNPVGSLIDATTAANTINANSATVVTAFDNTLSRDGTSPNQMLADLDMNSNRILNSPAPSNPNDLVRLQDLEAAASTSSLTPVTGTGAIVLQNTPTINTPIINTANLGSSSTATTKAQGTSDTTLATTAFVTSSPQFTGTPIAPTAAPGTNTTQLATTAFVSAALSSGSSNSSIIAQDPTIDRTGVAVVTTKVQNAINAIVASGNGISIPTGIYNLGNGTITIPDNTSVVCSAGAQFNRTLDVTGGSGQPYSDYTKCMINVGSNCRWTGGILNNSAVLTTSTTSNTINGSAGKTFTVGAGLNLVPGTSFVRIWSRSNPTNKLEATVTGYAGTTLTIGTPFFSGSGSPSDWNITYGAVYQAPMALHNTVNTVIDGVITQGYWYVGILTDSWNPSGGGSNLSKGNTFINCRANGIQNRGFYHYGNTENNSIISCVVDGQSTTDYAFALNPANATGSANSQNRTKIIGCQATGCVALGFSVGDACLYTLIDTCTATTINDVNAPGVGFIIQSANAGLSQFCQINNCVASFCGNGFSLIGTVYCSINGCEAISNQRGFYLTTSGAPTNQACTFTGMNSCLALGNTVTGFELNGSCNRCDMNDIRAISNTTAGVNITSSGSFATLVTGRSVSNGTNIINSGTSTQLTQLVTI